LAVSQGLLPVANGGTLESAVRWVGVTLIRGTRIWVGLILGFLADGMTHDEVLADDYPHLTDDDLRACLAYGALLATGRFIDVA